MITLPSYFKTSIKDILLVTVVSMVLMALVYPDLLVRLNLALSCSQDIEIPFQSSFSLLSDFYHGGPQLWNRFDQVNHAYAQLTAGLYTFPNIMESVIFSVIAPFFSHPAKAFHDFHILFYFTITTLVRTVGGYALLAHFTESRKVKILSLLVMNTLLCSSLYCGLFTNNLYSLLPLVSYFTLNFFRYFRLDDFLMLGFTMILAITNSPLFALGYFYEVVHYVIVLSIAIYFLTPNAIKLRDLFSYNCVKMLLTRSSLIKIGLFGLISGLLFLPNFIFSKMLSSDFYIGESRVSHALNPFGYLHGDWEGADPGAFFLRTQDYQNNMFYIDWVLIGTSVFVLSILGIILSKNPLRFIFLGAILLVFSANTPPGTNDSWYPGGRFAYGVGFHNPPLTEYLHLYGIAHLINAFTNPFSFLLRSHHMATLLMPLLFLPLVALGIEGCRHLHLDAWYDSRRLSTCLIILAIYWFACLDFLPAGIRSHSCGIILIAILFLLIQRRSYARLSPLCNGWIWGLCFTLIFGIDLSAYHTYLKAVPLDGERIKPLVFSGLKDPAIVAYQNPLIMTLPHYIAAEEYPQNPDYPLVHQSYPALFYHFIYYARLYDEKPNIYSPRHMRYKDFHEDSALLANLKANQKYIFFAPYALDSSKYHVEDLVTHQLNDQAIILDPGVSGTHYSDLSEISSTEPPPALKTQTFSFKCSDGRLTTHAGMHEIAFSLPKEFPTYMATTLFSRDRELLRASLNGQPLIEVQGKFVAPYSFDVQNITTGKLVIAVPKDSDVSAQSVELQVDTDPQIPAVNCNEQDTLDIDFNAPSAGWMVIRNPLEDGWKATVDGATSSVYSVNTSSMAVPVHAGTNHVLLQYLPYSPLRWMIWIVLILTPLSYFATWAIALFYCHRLKPCILPPV